MAVVTATTALTPAPHGVVTAVVAHAPTGAFGGQPRPLGEMAAVRMAVALTL